MVDLLGRIGAFLVMPESFILLLSGILELTGNAHCQLMQFYILVHVGKR